MLANLHIENIAVVRRADIDLGEGLTVITGETGAGKSVLIDSIKLLSGERARRELVRRGEDSATVAGLFTDLSDELLAALSELGVECEDGELYIQRTVNADGKGRFLISGRQVPMQLAREIGELLIAVHGQHENGRLLRPELHLSYLDRYASDEALIADYRERYSALRAIDRELSELEHDEQEKARLTEMLTYQIGDIDAAKLRPGEDEELERKRDRIRALERLSRFVTAVHTSLVTGDGTPSARDRIASALPALERLGDVVPDGAELIERLRSCMIEVEDIGETVYSLLDEDMSDSTKVLDRLESRLELITRLRRKYGATVNDILEFRENAAARLAALEDSDARADELRKQRKTVEREAAEAAGRVSAARREAGERLSAAVTAELDALEMHGARFGADIQPCPLGENGADSVQFVIATNSGDPLAPLQKIASGGELSRVMLALKCVLGDREGTGVMIFDEVDTGVSGKAAQKIGYRLRRVSRGTQVICITHSAQIAALADTHLLVSKETRDGRAETAVCALGEEQRTYELARIMGGETITEKLLESARELRALSSSDETRLE